jgi:hypothetical protein
MQFSSGENEGGCPKIDTIVVLSPQRSDLSVGTGHGFVQATVNQIAFVAASCNFASTFF